MFGEELRRSPINEARREDAIAKGVDPTTVKYLAVRAK